jgi:hypothetical protein
MKTIIKEKRKKYQHIRYLKVQDLMLLPSPANLGDKI